MYWPEKEMKNEQCELLIFQRLPSMSKFNRILTEAKNSTKERCSAVRVSWSYLVGEISNSPTRFKKLKGIFFLDASPLFVDVPASAPSCFFGWRFSLKNFKVLLIKSSSSSCSLLFASSCNFSLLCWNFSSETSGTQYSSSITVPLLTPACFCSS